MEVKEGMRVGRKEIGLIVLCMPAALIAALAAGAAGSQQSKGDTAKGKALFDTQCLLCHAPDKDEKTIGPGLKNLFKKDKMTNGKRPTEANIRAVIDAGGNGMPPYKDMLEPEEKDDLIAYLRTL